MNPQEGHIILKDSPEGRTCVCVCMYVCIYVCACVCVCIYIHA